MKIFILFFSVFIIASCKSDAIVEDSHNETHHDSIYSVEMNLVDSNLATVMDYSIDTFDIVDYYNFFFHTPINEFKDLDYKQAFEKKTYVLNELNYKNGFISFRTQNTPPGWDGDSETEYNYQITYWRIDSTLRIIALNKTEVTWVSEESLISFYKHDSSGINSFIPLKRMWRLDDFTTSNIDSYFDDSFTQYPPVAIELPNNGKYIRISLAIHEYYEPTEIFELFDSLNVNYHPIFIDPTEDIFKTFEDTQQQ